MPEATRRTLGKKAQMRAIQVYACRPLNMQVLNEKENFYECGSEAIVCCRAYGFVDPVGQRVTLWPRLPLRLLPRFYS
jgi:hypothetical protein